MKYLYLPYPLHIFDVITEFENRMTVMTSAEYVNLHERMYLADGRMSLKFLNEDLKTAFVTFSMKLFSPFLEEFESKIRRLVEAGICPDRLGGKKADIFPQRIDKELPAMVLTMEDLDIGFKICLIPLILSVVAFIYEVLVPRVKSMVINTITALVLVQACTKIRSNAW